MLAVLNVEMGDLPFVSDFEAFPLSENGEYCTFGLNDKMKTLDGTSTQVPGDKTIQEWMQELVPGAAAVIANGNCASFGGIPAANAGVTGSTKVSDIVA